MFAQIHRLKVDLRQTSIPFIAHLTQTPFHPINSASSLPSKHCIPHSGQIPSCSFMPLPRTSADGQRLTIPLLISSTLEIADCNPSSYCRGSSRFFSRRCLIMSSSNLSSASITCCRALLRLGFTTWLNARPDIRRFLISSAVAILPTAISIVHLHQ